MATDPFLAGYLPYLLQRTDQLLSARFHRSLRRRGIQTSDWRVLAVLGDTGPITIGELTRRGLLPQPTTTHAVGRMERQGSVVRRTSERDGRHTIVELTPAGRRLAQRLTEEAATELESTLQTAGIDVPAGFVRQLDTLIAALDHGNAD